MSTSLLKKLIRRPGRAANSQANASTPIVDISRVIPGYKSLVEREAELEMATPLAETLPDEDTDLSEPAAFETPPEELVEQAADALPEDLAEEAVDALEGLHDEWVKNDLERLVSAWRAVQDRNFDRAELSALKLAAHDLKGMATTYGHPAISRLAFSLCRLMENGVAAEQSALINLHIEACRAAYIEGGAAEGGDAIAKSVCIALEAQVNRTLTAS